MLLLRVIGGLLALALASPALAHTRSESHSTWVIDHRVVRVTITLPDLEAARIDPRGRRPDDRAVLAYLAPKVGVAAGADPCRTATPPLMVLAATGFRRAEIIFDCPREAGLTLRFDGFFDLVSSHIDLAQIQYPDGELIEQLFTDDAHTLELGAENDGQLGDAGFLRFVEMGVMHIFTGVDHMSFLLGLVLISKRLRDLIFVVTGFTIGHSVTLGLAVTGVIRPHAEYIDALVALTIALIGIENIVVSLPRPDKLALAAGGLLLAMTVLRLLGYGTLPPLLLIGAALFTTCYLLISGHLQDVGRLRIVVTAVFGLVHGFGFAADLLESQLPKQKLAEILVGFNLGVEVGQLSVVLIITGIVTLARRLRWATPRPITVDMVGSALVGLGMFWFVGRSF